LSNLIGSGLEPSIRVGAFDISIKDHPNPDRLDEWGNFSSRHQRIEISFDDLSGFPFKFVDTVLHEISHAIWWAYGLEDDDKEERVVATMASAWVQVYRDNPWLIDFIRTRTGSAG